MKITILFLLNIVFNTLGNLLIKQAMIKVKDIELNTIYIIITKVIFNPTLIIGCIFYGLSLLVYSFILQKINLNTAYPITVSGSILLVTLISVLIFKESFKTSNFVGIFAILIGIYFIVK